MCSLHMMALLLKSHDFKNVICNTAISVTSTIFPTTVILIVSVTDVSVFRRHG